MEEREVRFPQLRNQVDQGRIIGNPHDGVRTRSSTQFFYHVAFISHLEPKNIDDALKDDYWIIAMQEELNQFERSQVWERTYCHQGIARRTFLAR